MKKAYIVTGLGFGDEGKGTIVDYLTYAKNATLNVKFNGGSQAAHNVHQPDGRHFTFSQFGSGSHHDAETYISSYVAVDPLAMLAEGESLSKQLDYDAFSLMNIHKNCAIITPYHRDYNRNNNLHGSCGVGHGITVKMQEEGGPVLYFKDLANEDKTREKLLEISRYLGYNSFSDYNFKELFDKVIMVKSESNMLGKHKVVVFEGAQGTLLDRWHGFFPYVTRSVTTHENAKKIINGSCDTYSIGVIRTHMTRHGDGPFPTAGTSIVDDDDNSYNDFQKEFRVGYFDLDLLKYALKANPVDGIALTHCDKVDSAYASDYMDLEPSKYKSLDYSTLMTKYVELVQPVYIYDDLPKIYNICITSYGKTYKDKHEYNKFI